MDIIFSSLLLGALPFQKMLSTYFCIQEFSQQNISQIYLGSAARPRSFRGKLPTFHLIFNNFFNMIFWLTMPFGASKSNNLNYLKALRTLLYHCSFSLPSAIQLSKNMSENIKTSQRDTYSCLFHNTEELLKNQGYFIQ